MRSEMENNAHLAIVDYRKNEITLDQLAAKMMPLIKRIATTTAYGIRMDIADDIMVSLWLKFQEVGIKQWDENRSIGAYLTTISRNKSFEIWKEQKPYTELKFDDNGNSINVLEEYKEAAIESAIRNDPAVNIDKKIAIEKIKEKLINSKKYKKENNEIIMINNNVQIEVDADADEDNQIIKKPAKKHDLSQDQLELADIHRALKKANGLTQAQLADQLNIGHPRLASYLSGRTYGVPEHIMKSARALVKKANIIPHKFEGLSINQILEQWSNILELKNEEENEIAILIGIEIETFNNWKNNINLPDENEINRLDKIVQLILKSIERSKKNFNKLNDTLVQ
jgi:transcriptional regulator with XRE-family HTH domain